MEQWRRQGMAEQMGACERGMPPGSLQRATHDRTAPCAVGASTAGRPHPDKDAPRGHRRAAWTEVGGSRLADLRGQRQAIVAGPCALDQECSGFPSESIQAQGHHFCGP